MYLVSSRVLKSFQVVFGNFFLTTISLYINETKSVYYGAVEAIIVSIYCVWAWKNGWTKAPTDASLWQVLTTSYEVKTIDEVEQPQDDGVQVPSLKVSENTDEKEAWDYVDYGDAEVTKPQADTKEASDSKKWYSFV